LTFNWVITNVDDNDLYVTWRVINLAGTLLKHVGLGLAVTVAVTIPWSALAGLNLRLSPRVPWAIPVGFAYICAATAYLNGSGWPKSTSSVRKRSFRAQPLAQAEISWALLAGFAGVLSLWLLFAASGYLSAQPTQASQSDLPPLVLLGATLIAAAVAAIAEEGGLRGFMQAPLERLIGPAPAIVITSCFFVLIHLSHGVAALARNGPFYFAAGCVYGLLAYFTQSILPSLILHFLGDILVFALGFSLVHFARPREPGTRAVLAAFALLVACASVTAFFKLARLTSSKRFLAVVEDANSRKMGSISIT
jgi:membrane protease YdiL (CAAX protease family)